MKVILKSDVNNLGRAGQVLVVKSGYARNYLFPKNLALPARSNSLKELKHKNLIATSKAKKANLRRGELVKKLEGHTFTFSKEATPKGTLFGSVSSHEITLALKAEGFDIDKKCLIIASPIKTTGKHSLYIRFEKDCQAQINIEIQGKEKEKPNETVAEKINLDPEETSTQEITNTSSATLDPTTSSASSSEALEKETQSKTKKQFKATRTKKIKNKTNPTKKLTSFSQEEKTKLIKEPASASDKHKTSSSQDTKSSIFSKIFRKK